MSICAGLIYRARLPYRTIWRQEHMTGIVTLRSKRVASISVASSARTDSPTVMHRPSQQCSFLRDSLEVAVGPELSPRCSDPDMRQTDTRLPKVESPIHYAHIDTQIYIHVYTDVYCVYTCLYTYLLSTHVSIHLYGFPQITRSAVSDSDPCASIFYTQVNGQLALRTCL